VLTTSNTLTSDNKPLYTIGITANLLGVCQATLRIWEKKGLIEPHRIGKNRFYSASDLEKLHEIKRLLRNKRLNIEGVKEVTEKVFCWEIKNCLPEERQACPVYQYNKLEVCETKYEKM